eukprot:7630407-Pyramimonas_sp.AAC.1
MSADSQCWSPVLALLEDHPTQSPKAVLNLRRCWEPAQWAEPARVVGACAGARTLLLAQESLWARVTFGVLEAPHPG